MFKEVVEELNLHSCGRYFLKIKIEFIEVKYEASKMKNKWNEISSRLNTARETVNELKTPH